LNECMKVWLRGSLDDVMMSRWVDGRRGNESVNTWTEKWTVTKFSVTLLKATVCKFAHF